MSKKTPVAFFAYNRPEHARRALEALCKCHKLDGCDFHLFSDGPRTDASRTEIDATRKVLHDWAASFGANVVEQPHNLGLAKSIVTGVSDLCDRYGRVIVVEDDLIVSPDFLDYMIQSLDYYHNESQVMQVGGFTLSPPPVLATDAFLLPVTTTWGWATWQRAWQNFSWEPVNLEDARNDEKWRKRFDVNGTCAFWSMLEDRLARRNDSWGILWWYAVSRQSGLVVYPSQSLVWNGGFDGTGIHCGSGDFLQQGEASNYSRTTLPNTLSFPPADQFDPAHLSLLEDFFSAMSNANQLASKDSAKGSKLKGLALKLKARIGNAFS